MYRRNESEQRDKEGLFACLFSLKVKLSVERCLFMHFLEWVKNDTSQQKSLLFVGNKQTKTLQNNYLGTSKERQILPEKGNFGYILAFQGEIFHSSEMWIVHLKPLSCPVGNYSSSELPISLTVLYPPRGLADSQWGNAMRHLLRRQKNRDQGPGRQRCNSH